MEKAEAWKHVVQWADMGFDVLFVRADGSKEPFGGSHGLNDATKDKTKLREILKQLPNDVLVAIVPGSAGYLVLDPDEGPKQRRRADGTTYTEIRNGLKKLAELEQTFETLPKTGSVRTPSGGKHIYFKKPEGTFFGSAGFAEHIDVRADKGYVLAPSMPGYTIDYPVEQSVQAPQWVTDRLEIAGDSFGRYAKLDKSKLDPADLEMLEYLEKKCGGHGAFQQGNGYIGICGPHVNHNCASIGSIGPGVVKIFDTRWIVNGKDLSTGKPFATAKPGVYNIEQLKEFVEGPRITVTAPRGELWTPTRVREQARVAPKWLIKGWIEEGQTVDLFADWGTGKTFLAIDWMLHLAAGKDWNGCRVKAPTSVVYVVGEGWQGWPKRVEAWEQQHERRVDGWVAHNAPINLFRMEDVAHLREQTDYLQPKLFIFDTWSACTAGADGNADKDVKIAVSNLNYLKENGATVLVLNHPGHAVKDRSKGSSVLHGAVDITIKLATENGDRNDPRLILSNDKNRDQAKAQDVALLRQDIWLEGIVDDDGEPTSTCVIVPREAITAEERSVQLSPNEQKLLQSLESISPVTGGVESGAFKARAMADHGWARDRPFYDALKRLVDNGLIIKSGPSSKPLYSLPDVYINMSEREAKSGRKAA